MTTYAVAREVPENRHYLTAGKRYEVFESWGSGFAFLDNDGKNLWAGWKTNTHLNNKDWHRIETDADGWAEWKPSKNGEAPPDWQDGWEWELLDCRGKWIITSARSPAWYATDTYRYRPRAIAEPAQPECDHPNAEDYRNRAERAEAEAAEWKGRAERAEVMVATLKEVAQLWRRIGKLEALACDQLLEGDV